ncbi:hypothetical protein QA5_00541 [Enterococcus faecalis EnGen0083]|uniref:YopX family protein n=1 Tax=Enterococcus faecalis TaxID=1351 RepID=UPI000330AA70|nr:YopX family protein [Enterococcus faecalis]DAU70122.1 MAG TPA: YopX protein [Caudoviricetes sp.]EOE02793.1 hypothetical protein Q9K_00401 [Enterococcus faecalis EnGen0075]EOE18008.1 hypothetical protein Q9W_00911 [Enterococcus faecalis EnGen0060]EOE25021.1 hypothetical protein QA5_00541 [Enterococcus faecalis EnGen0083]HBI1997689.1 DNA-packaging protein [Enterococcus faecalis]
MILKFRAWDKNTNDMVDVKTIDLEKDGSIGCIVDYNGINLDMSECVLMQSTGLKDKNGVEIFEGDIIIFPNGCHKETMFVRLSEKRAGFSSFEIGYVWRNIFDAPELDSYWWGTKGIGHPLVTGNIYENPELLESVQNERF